MSQPDEHQQDLLHAAKNGDDDARGELIENFRPLLRAEAHRTLRDVQGRVDASDVVQMTWSSAFRAFPRFTGDVDAFVGWLRKIHERNLQDAVRDQHAGVLSIGRWLRRQFYRMLRHDSHHPARDSFAKNSRSK